MGRQSQNRTDKDWMIKCKIILLSEIKSNLNPKMYNVVTYMDLTPILMQYAAGITHSTAMAELINN